VATEHRWLEREVTLRHQKYQIRHCERCHWDTVRPLGDTVWAPVRVNVFTIDPLSPEAIEHWFAHDCDSASREKSCPGARPREWDGVIKLLGKPEHLEQLGSCAPPQSTARRGKHSAIIGVSGL
jgi:hypothetical protein